MWHSNFDGKYLWLSEKKTKKKNVRPIMQRCAMEGGRWGAGQGGRERSTVVRKQ